MNRALKRLILNSKSLTLFLTIFFLPTQLGKHFWPAFSYIYSLPVDYLSPTFYFWDILVLGLLILLLWERRVNHLALNLFLLLLLTQSLSLLSSQNIGASLVGLFEIAVSGLLGVYIASQKFKEIKTPLFWGLALSIILEGLLAFYQFFSTHTLGLWVLGERSFDISTPSIATFNFLGQVFLRPYGTFPHPNVLAAFMVLALPLVYVLRVLSDPSPNRRPRSLYSLRALVGGPPVSATRNTATLLAAFSVLLSFSRAGLLVLGVELVYLFRKKWKYLLIPLVLLGPLLWIRYNSAFNFDYLSILRREQLDLIALTDFSSSPVLGVGLNNFITTTASSQLIAGPTRFLQPAHNIILLILAETGLVGLLGWLGLFGVAVRKLWLNREDPFSQLLLFSWGTILFLGMFDHYFLTLPQGQRLLFLVWGLSLVKR